MHSGQESASFEDVCITPELSCRPSRPPDFARETQALAELANLIANAPGDLAQRLVETARELCGAQAAGVSFLASVEAGAVFQRVTISGIHSRYQGSTVDPEHSPTGHAARCGTPQLFTHPARYYRYLDALDPPIVEALVAPVFVGGAPRGALWIAATDETVKFTAEDARILTNLSGFAASLHVIAARDASEVQLNMVMAAAPVLISYVDREQRFRFNNLAYARWFGLQPGELIGRHIADVLGAEAYAAVRAEVETALAGTRITYEREMPYLSGSRFVRTSLVPDITADNEVRGFIAVIMDISDRKRVEEALFASEIRYRTMIEQAPISIQVMAPDGTTLRVNQAWEQLWGATVANLEGYNMLADPQLEARGVLHLVQRAFDGEAATIPPVSYVPPTGAFAGLQRWVRAHIYPVRDESGSVREVVLMHEDISDQWEAEQALRRQLEITGTITDHVAEAILLTDSEGRTTFVNQAAEQMFGWSREEMIGKHPHAVLHYKRPDGSAYPAEECPLSRAVVECTTVLSHEDAFFHKSGELVYVLCSSVPIVTGDMSAGTVFAARNITGRKKEEMRRRFLAEVGELLSATLDSAATLNSLAGLIVPNLADWCIIYLAGESNSLRREVLMHSEPEKAERVNRLAERYPVTMESNPAIARIIQTGEPQVRNDITGEMLRASARDDDHFELLSSLGLRAYMGVPMKARGVTMGALILLGAERNPNFSSEDLALAEEVARRAATALDNALLYEAERERSSQLAVAISEVHHRIKNNLQALAALLEMQMPDDGGSVPVESVRDSLSQIKTIALVHDLLARDQPIGSVNMAQVLANLARLMPSAHNRQCRVQVESADLPMPTKEATALALAVNELITNSMKHAAGHALDGHTITVELKRSNDNVLVVVSDTGPGFPEGFDVRTDANVGLQLVQTLVQHDLRGAVRYRNCDEQGRVTGACVEIEFPYLEVTGEAKR